MNNKPWNDYYGHIRKIFGERAQKIAVNTGFGCPNMDGSISNLGCTYCNNNNFTPFYCDPKDSVKKQLKKGIEVFSDKYKAQKFLAYFQSYTNTYTSDENFKKIIEEALEVERVEGLVVSTRPDCISNEKIEILHNTAKNYYVSLELGIESTINRSLERINRGHNYQRVKKTFEKCRNKNFDICAHLILGLPGESREDILSHPEEINKLYPDTIKLHHLQILKNAPIADEFKQVPEDFVYFDVESYIELISDFLELTNPEIVFERFINDSPVDLIISPNWNGIKNYYFIEQLEKYMRNNNSFQGKKYLEDENY